MAELSFARVCAQRANRQRYYLTVTFLRLKVQWPVRYRARLGQHRWFSLATLVDIRSLGASHCLIRRLNR